MIEILTRVFAIIGVLTTGFLIYRERYFFPWFPLFIIEVLTGRVAKGVIKKYDESDDIPKSRVKTYEKLVRAEKWVWKRRIHYFEPNKSVVGFKEKEKGNK